MSDCTMQKAGFDAAMKHLLRRCPDLANEQSPVAWKQAAPGSAATAAASLAGLHSASNPG